MIRMTSESMEVLQRSNLSISIADPDKPDCPLIFVNEKCAETTGYTEHEMLGRNCRLLQCEKTSRTELLKVKKAVDQGKPTTACILNQRKCGKLFWNLLIISPIRIGDAPRLLGCQYDLGSKPHSFDIGLHTDRYVDVLEQVSTWPSLEGWQQVRRSMRMHAQAVLLIAQTRVAMNGADDFELSRIRRQDTTSPNSKAPQATG